MSDFVTIGSCSGGREPNERANTRSKSFRFRLQKPGSNVESPRSWSSLPTGIVPSLAKTSLGIFPPEHRPVLALPTTFCKGRALGYKDMPWAKVRGEAPCRRVKKPRCDVNAGSSDLQKTGTTHSHQLKAGIRCDCSGVPWWAGTLTSAASKDGVVYYSGLDPALYYRMKMKPVPCKCGCSLSVEVCQKLFEHGIPSLGLTTGQAGLIMGKLAQNDWKLPESFAFVKNPGEWIERKWLGRKANK